jgi:hypothetical protein|tara:strand:- start:1916 stop:2110 length:195 start_codon:yes stop_codon:yes gene_type:complete
MNAKYYIYIAAPVPFTPLATSLGGTYLRIALFMIAVFFVVLAIIIESQIRQSKINNISGMQYEH